MKIVTSLSFRGECREAFEFYAKVLGGQIIVAMATPRPRCPSVLNTATG